VKDAGARRKWALACFHLGNPEPFKRLAGQLRRGEVPGADFEGTVHYLSCVALPEADQALFALANPRHANHAQVLARLFGREYHDSWGFPVLGHPFCLRVMREALDDVRPTGTTVKIERDGVVWHYPWNMGGYGPVPDLLRDPMHRKTEARERRCDQAAAILAKLVAGFPEFSALCNDADDRITAMKRLLDVYQGRIRRLSAAERPIFFGCCDLGMYCPDVAVLARPASADDVRAGRALFHLNGKGKLAGVQLPAAATWKKAGADGEPRKCLIVQAEVGPDGEVVYGVIERHGMRAVPDGEFATVKPLPTSRP
jgi:hypothetical protein